MERLPVQDIREKFANALRQGNRCILCAPAGSGKSTLVPQFLIDDNLVDSKSVIVLQPRRIAARMLANYIALQRNVRCGAEVGYRVRFEGQHSAETRILFVTEGILLNRLFQNDLLQEVGAIVFDEFHERHLETDMGLALALQLQKTNRPDLKIIVMSATLDVAQVKGILGECPLIESQGRAYPVEIAYKQCNAYDKIWDSAANALETEMRGIGDGSALVFMSGAYEIRKTIESIQKKASLSSFNVYPLHGSLTKEEQENAVREGGRKIIVTTNVAETSLTIPLVRLVIDSGQARVLRFDARRGINTLFTESISASSADQRAGRAGRVAPGKCVRLWGEFENANRVSRPMPEIQRVDLSETLLGLAAMGYNNPMDFKWIESPSPISIERGVGLLQNLGALDDLGQITPLGKEMAALGIHPRFARMLVCAGELDCLPAACVVAALAQSNSIFNNTNDPIIIQEREYTFGNPASDLLFELNAWLWAGKQQFKASECSRLAVNAHTARQIGQIAIQLLARTSTSKKDKKLPDVQLSCEETLSLRECIFTGFVDFIAIRHRAGSPVCQMMHGKSGKLHPLSSVQNARLMVVTELEESKTNSGVQLSLRKVTEVEESWLARLVTKGVSLQSEIVLDATQKRVVEVVRHVFNELNVFTETREVANNDVSSEFLTEAILSGKIEFSKWDEEVEHFVRRANFAARNAPHYGIPLIDDEAKRFIIQQSIYKCRSLKDLDRCNLWTALKAWFSFEQLASIDYLAPVSVNLPRRKFPVKLRYDEKGNAVLSETVQALYDLLPVTLCEGKVQVVYEILAPSRRPVQITRDLDYFWKNSYNDVKKDLKGRYPKHEWR